MLLLLAAGQHIALHEPSKPNHIGLICTKCSPWQVSRLAVPLVHLYFPHAQTHTTYTSLNRALLQPTAVVSLQPSVELHGAVVLRIIAAGRYHARWMCQH